MSILPYLTVEHYIYQKQKKHLHFLKHLTKLLSTQEMLYIVFFRVCLMFALFSSPTENLTRVEFMSIPRFTAVFAVGISSYFFCP